MMQDRLLIFTKHLDSAHPLPLQTPQWSHGRLTKKPISSLCLVSKAISDSAAGRPGSKDSLYMTDCSVPGKLPEGVDSSEDMPGELRMPAMHQSAATEDHLHLVPASSLWLACSSWGCLMRESGQKRRQAK